MQRDRPPALAEFLRQLTPFAQHRHGVIRIGFAVRKRPFPVFRQADTLLVAGIFVLVAAIFEPLPEVHFNRLPSAPMRILNEPAASTGLSIRLQNSRAT